MENYDLINLVLIIQHQVVLILVHHQLRFMEVVLHGGVYLVDIVLLVQPNLMEHYGCGDIVVLDN